MEFEIGALYEIHSDLLGWTHIFIYKGIKHSELKSGGNYIFENYETKIVYTPTLNFYKKLPVKRIGNKKEAPEYFL